MLWLSNLKLFYGDLLENEDHNKETQNQIVKLLAVFYVAEI